MQHIDHTANEVKDEYARARKKFPPMRGPHEGYAVLLEEVDELWDAIKANDLVHARKEAIQVAAMAMALIAEVLTPEPVVADNATTVNAKETIELTQNNSIPPTRTAPNQATTHFLLKTFLPSSEISFISV